MKKIKNFQDFINESNFATGFYDDLKFIADIGMYKFYLNEDCAWGIKFGSNYIQGYMGPHPTMAKINIYINGIETDKVGIEYNDIFDYELIENIQKNKAKLKKIFDKLVIDIKSEFPYK